MSNCRLYAHLGVKHLCHCAVYCMHRDGPSNQMDLGSNRSYGPEPAHSGVVEERGELSEGLRSTEYPLTGEQFDSLVDLYEHLTRTVFLEARGSAYRQHKYKVRKELTGE